jgi:crossover junction endodeoxyribonuclease RusA
MAKRLSFTVPGVPRPKERPRFGAGGRVFTPKGTQQYEILVSLHARRAMAIERWLTTEAPMAVWMHLYLPDRRRRDVDNIAKAIADALNTLVYFDDTQICELHIYKRIDKNNPRVGLEFEALYEDRDHD